ncbi:hypothetical protein ACFVR6_07440 [Microbacterium sp. NPDC058021]|uniref:hypothetical protein n=1 Tax=Microbacterium sp. NPDC058021 TaxID=3346306 RepID=UPI0036DF7B80
MRSRPGRGAAALVAGLALCGLIVVGCAAQPYDSALWRQIRAQQAVVSDELLRSPQPFPRDALVDRLRTVSIVWESRETPPLFPGTEPASVIHSIREAGVDSFGDPLVRFTEFVSSGVRQDVPRGDERRREGPSTMYTCYTWEVVFVADRVWDARRPGYAEGVDVECDERLIALLPEDATHIATADLVE